MRMKNLKLAALVLVVFLASSASAWCPPTDLTGDCEVNLPDLQTLAEEWLSPPESPADLNGDDAVNIVDFVLLANQWGRKGVPLYINEFMASNSGGIQDAHGDYDDWIEIYNAGDEAIDIGGMYITTDLADPTMSQIPTGRPYATTLPSHRYVLIWADDETSLLDLHASFKLDVDAIKTTQIGLFDKDGRTLIDSVHFGPQEKNISYGRYPDTSENWQFMSFATPRNQNTGGYEDIVDDVKFSHNRGFYNTSFSVTIATETDEAEIYYTLNGSTPFDVKTGVPTPAAILYTAPITISKTTCLRAVAVKPGWKPSKVDTHTYIFINDVIKQSPNGELPGTGWAQSGTNGQTINYGMDPDIVNSSTYKNLIDDALLAIPTISFVTDLANLFSPTTGIYVNAGAEGIAWERPLSVELINPDGTEGFQIDAGVRIRGGYSTSGGNPKHAFRLFFRDTYGYTKLEYPLFEDEGVDKFDHVDLRCSQNYSWAFEGNPANTDVRDVFSRDAQGETGQPYTKSRYYHLYVNGQYWGLFQTEERPEASFGASYFGGEQENYDAVSSNWTAGRRMVATDGTRAALDRLYNLTMAGFSNQARYYGAQGMNVDGTRNPAYERLLDVDNLIDFMIVEYYSGDRDGPGSRFGDIPNNTWGVYNRVNPDGWKWMHHDNEHALGAPASEENLVTPFTWAGAQKDYFNPHWLHEQLANVNIDYRMHFADHVYRHFFNDGLLTLNKSRNLIQYRANQIDMAIIAESARWGDSKRHPPLTQNDWRNEINWMLYTTSDNRCLTNRVNVVLQQFKSVGWYPSINPPTFNQNGGMVSKGFNLTMSNPNGSGTIYYTLDGADPRSPGGAINTSHATAYTKAVTLNHSTYLKARVLSGTTWSALAEAVFAIGQVKENLRITEIMYHPQDANDPSKEFIELMNIGPQALNLNLVQFTEGIQFTFPDIELPPDAFVVVVKDLVAFQTQYGTGINVAGQYTGGLENAGERIRLADALCQTILDFKYSDGWRDITDGNGFSLTIINPADPNINHWGKKDYWRASVYWGGSPGEEDSGILPNPGDVVINEILAHSHAGNPDWIELYNTIDSPIYIGGWFLSDSDSDLKKYKIALGTTIPKDGFLVFYEDTNFHNLDDPGCLVEFALSENGETVYLTAADTSGQLLGYREFEDFGASPTDVSFGRYHKLSTGNVNFVLLRSKTPNGANDYPKVGPIVINEIMYHPDWPEGGIYSNDEYEYVELRNITASPVTLYDYDVGLPWIFTNGIEYIFPDDPPVTIPSGGCIVVVRNKTAFSLRYPGVPSNKIYGPYGGHLDNAGESLELSQPGDEDELGVRYYIRVDRVHYSDGSHPQDCPGDVDLWPVEPDGYGMSLGRLFGQYYGNDPNNWTAISPSPANP